MVVNVAAQKHFREEAQTQNESNFISPTTLIVCEASKMLPQDPYMATLPFQSAVVHSVWMTVFTSAFNYWIN